MVGLTGRSADPERVTQERRRNHGRNLILTAAEAAEAVLEVEVVAGVVVKLSGFTVVVTAVVMLVVVAMAAVVVKLSGSPWGWRRRRRYKRWRWWW